MQLQQCALGWAPQDSASWQLDEMELHFCYPDITGQDIELKNNGAQITVNNRSAREMADLILKDRLEFDRVQLQAVQQGLGSIVPLDLLQFWTWQDLQTRVCGAADIDIDSLKRHTQYENDRDHAVVPLLWEVLEAFTQKQRRSFLRFVWGRTRLPLGEQWPKNFRLEVSPTDQCSETDERLPVSHTCFFKIDLPNYSSKQICHKQLLYAISNCMAIDADTTGNSTAARELNWDEEDDDDVAVPPV